MAILGPFTFEGGLNTKTGAYDIPKNQIVDGQNMELVNNRMAKKNGNTKWTSTQHPGLFSITAVAYFHDYLVAYCSGKVAWTSALVPSTWTDITAALTFTNNYPGWTGILNNILVLGGNGSAPIQWTGTGNCTTLGGSPPSGTLCGTVCNNYLFTGSNSAFPSRVWWSAVLDPTTWPAANYVDVNLSDTGSAGFGIYALIAFGEDLLIFKNDSVARLYTNQISGSLGPLVTVSDKLGCFGPNMVDRLNDGRIAFVGSDAHVYLYDGNTFTDISNPPSPISNIQALINNLNGGNFTQGAYNGFLRYYRSKNQIWVSYPATYVNPLGTSYAGLILIYDVSNQVWLPPYVDHIAYCGINYILPAGHNYGELFITGGNGGRLYREDDGYVNSDTSASNANFDGYFTKSLNLGAEQAAFVPRSIYFPYTAGSFAGSFSGACYYGFNGYNNPSSANTITSAGNTNAEKKKVVLVKSPSTGMNTMQIRFDGSFTGQPFTVEPFFLSDQIEVQI